MPRRRVLAVPLKGNQALSKYKIVTLLIIFAFLSSPFLMFPRSEVHAASPTAPASDDFGSSGSLAGSGAPFVSGGSDNQGIGLDSFGPDIGGGIEASGQFSQVQDLVTVSYSTADGSTPSAPVVLRGTQFGNTAFSVTLSTTPQNVLLDNGTVWWVTNPIVSGSERWCASSGSSGLVSAQNVVAPVYSHQFQVSFDVYPYEAGSIDPQTTAFYDAGATVPLTAYPNWPSVFYSWGSTTSGITINNQFLARSTGGGEEGGSGGSDPTPTATINGAGTISANFWQSTDVERCRLPVEWGFFGFRLKWVCSHGLCEF